VEEIKVSGFKTLALLCFEEGKVSGLNLLLFSVFKTDRFQVSISCSSLSGRKMGFRFFDLSLFSFWKTGRLKC